MSEKNVDPVIASYHRCREDEFFVDTFYQYFLAKSADIAKMFEHTDFTRQKLMLRESLLEMLCYDRGVEGAEAEIQRIAHRHLDLGIPPEMYTMWLDSLCEAVEQHDPKYTPELGQQWRDSMQKGIDLMLSQRPT
jgi:hemoglobin-like flavoprotein